LLSCYGGNGYCGGHGNGCYGTAGNGGCGGCGGGWALARTRGLSPR
jgi:hypothetical protein